MSIRKDILEDESNADRWMISYADFITLLFAFFVVMYAISSVNDDKYKVLSDTLAQAFEAKLISPDVIQVGEPTPAASPHVVDIPDVDGWADPDEGNTQITSDDLQKGIKASGFSEDAGISVVSNNDWLELTIGGSLLFPAGSATLSPEAGNAIGVVQELLASNSNPVTIEGYTDNVPSESAVYNSNWVLSAARASAVAQYLVQGGIRRERVSAVGYGENHAIATNATPDGRASNRRVVIVVARRTDLARNRNTEHSTAIVDRSRRIENNTVIPTRKADGGLLFTGEE
ncbi:MAG: OmpA family protein [Pseudomonadales bacterium]|nr:OmpA family protein [Pseudomonadales bacterium]